MLNIETELNHRVEYCYEFAIKDKHNASILVYYAVKYAILTHYTCKI